MKAYITSTDPIDGSEVIFVNGHDLQFGGQGDGYCYQHQQFECFEELTDEEWSAINRAERKEIDYE